MHEFSIIIPQYGRSELTLAAAKSLQQTHSESLEILIVDDGSPAEERKQLQSQLRGDICLLRQPQRRGVTAAWNLGARVASGNFLIFLNNDTISQGPWLTALTAPLKNRECLLTAPRWRLAPELPAGQRKVLTGWCLACCRTTFISLGGFDERFRLYFSDTDFQLQLMKQFAAPLRVISGLPLIHLGHCSTRQLKSRSREWKTDHARFIHKWNLKEE